MSPRANTRLNITEKKKLEELLEQMEKAKETKKKGKSKEKEKQKENMLSPKKTIENEEFLEFDKFLTAQMKAKTTSNLKGLKIKIKYLKELVA